MIKRKSKHILERSQAFARAISRGVNNSMFTSHAARVRNPRSNFMMKFMSKALALNTGRTQSKTNVFSHMAQCSAAPYRWRHVRRSKPPKFFAPLPCWAWRVHGALVAFTYANSFRGQQQRLVKHSPTNSEGATHAIHTSKSSVSRDRARAID